MKPEELRNESLIRLLVDQAAAAQAKIAVNGVDAVEKIVAEADVSFGVWQDASRPLGVGCLVIRGEKRMKQIRRDGKARRLKVGAIPCICIEQAFAVRQVFGDGAIH